MPGLADHDMGQIAIVLSGLAGIVAASVAFAVGAPRMLMGAAIRKAEAQDLLPVVVVMGHGHGQHRRDTNRDAQGCQYASKQLHGCKYNKLIGMSIYEKEIGLVGI